MNNKIKLVSESSHPKHVNIVVSDANTMEPVDFTLEEDGTKVVSIHQSSTMGLEDKTILRYHLSLVSPPDLKDLQYVMDAIVLPELDEENSKKDDGQQIDVRFTSSTRGCEDKRAHGRKNDNGLIIELAVPSSTFEAPSDGHIVGVDIVAGWACGHEAVTLTHPIRFIPISYMLKNEGATKSEQIPEQQITEKEEDTDDANLPDIPGSVYVEPDEMDREDAEKMDNTNLRRGRRYEREHPSIDEEAEEEARTADGVLKQFKIDHDKETFGQASFSIMSYFVGTVVLIALSIGIVIILISRGKPEAKEL